MKRLAVCATVLFLLLFPGPSFSETWKEGHDSARWADDAGGNTPITAAVLNNQRVLNLLVSDPSVKDKDLITAPGTPANRDKYIVAGTGGGWSACAVKDIAIYDVSTWVCITPQAGFVVNVEDEGTSGKQYRYNGTAWESRLEVGAATIDGSPLSVISADDVTTEINESDQIQVKDGGIGTSQVTDDAITPAKVDETGSYKFSSVSTDAINEKTPGAGVILNGRVSHESWPISGISDDMKRYGVVLSPTPAAWDSVDVGLGDIIKISSTYYMIYSGSAGSGADGREWRAGVATSTDLITWTKQGKVFDPPTGYSNIIPSSIYYESGTYYIFSHGRKTGSLVDDVDAWVNWVHTTTDFVTFSLVGVAVSNQGLGLPYALTNASVKKVGSYYYMSISDYYEGGNPNSGIFRIRLLRSSSITSGWERTWDGVDHVLLSPEDAKYTNTSCDGTIFDTKLFTMGGKWILSSGCGTDEGQTGFYNYHFHIASSIEGPYFTLPEPYYRHTGSSVGGRTAVYFSDNYDLHLFYDHWIGGACSISKIDNIHNIATAGEDSNPPVSGGIATFDASGNIVSSTSLTGIAKLTAGVVASASAGDFPTLNQNTTGTSSALTANGANCSAGNYPLGVDAAGAVESCTALPDYTSLMTVAKLKPASDSTTAIQLTKADGTTNIFNINSSSGRTGINTAAPASKLHVVSDRSIDNVGVSQFDAYGTEGLTGTATASMLFRSAVGSEASPTHITTDTLTLNMQSQGYYDNSGTGYKTLGAFRIYADGDTTLTSSPGRLSLWTVPSGSTAAVERFTIKNNGFIGIATDEPDTELHVKGGLCIDTDEACTDPGDGNADIVGNLAVGGNVSVLGTLNARASLTSDADGINLVDADCGKLILMTGAGEVGMPDCDAGLIGCFISIWVRDASEQVQVVAYGDTTNDLFRLKSGTETDANDEADLTTNGNEQFTFMCMETNKWYVYSQDGTVTDGGAAD